MVGPPWGPVTPMTNVMPLREPQPTAREAAAPVPSVERAPQRRRNRPGKRPDLERAPIRVMPQHHSARVARQPPRDGAPIWDEDRLYALFPNLAAMPDRPGGRMSGGEQQMLTVARTLMGNPHLVLLDEPSEGVAPLIVEEMARMIAALKREGVAILLSEQNLHFARLVCDRAVVLEKGEVRFAGTMDALMSDEALQRTHLSM